MLNDSQTNEKLITLIKNNLSCTPEHKKLTVFYHTILNNTIRQSVTNYQDFVLQTTPESIAHHGCINPLLTFKYKQREHNTAVALNTLRKIITYKQAKMILNNLDSDYLYQKINDYKYFLNVNFYNLFDLSK